MKKAKYIVALLLLCAVWMFIAGCRQKEDTPNEAIIGSIDEEAFTGTTISHESMLVQGIVFERKSIAEKEIKENIEGAVVTVYLVDNETATEITCISNVDGTFEFDLPVGEYSLKAEAEGYNSLTTSFIVTADNKLYLELSLNLNRTQTLLQLKYSPKSGKSILYSFLYKDETCIKGLEKKYSDGTEIQWPTYSYDENERLIWKIWGEPANEYAPGMNSGVGYEYNSEGQLVREFSWEGGRVDTYHKYDSTGKCVLSTVDTDMVSERKKYNYDENGILTHAEVTREYFNESEVYTITYSYFCNNCIVIESFSNDEMKKMEILSADGIPLEEFWLVAPQYTTNNGILEKIEDSTGDVYIFNYGE